MKTNLKLSLVTGLLLAAGVAYSQAPMMGCDMHEGMQSHGMDHPGMGGMGHMDPTKMQAMMDKRHAALKAQLKLTPAQEPAWAAFMEAHKPPAGKLGKPEMPDMSKLTTPERIDKMRELHAQRVSERAAEMDKRGAATKTFYAALTPEQQKLFDAHEMKGHGMKGHDMPVGQHGNMPAMPAKN
jgi:Spy/CpxP family protein refolding chaperone